MMIEPRLAHQVQSAVEANFDNQREAFAVLDLIVAEFNSDPMSVQCFDLRVVERAKECIRKRNAFLASPAGAIFR